MMLHGVNMSVLTPLICFKLYVDLSVLCTRWIDSFNCHSTVQTG